MHTKNWEGRRGEGGGEKRGGEEREVEGRRWGGEGREVEERRGEGGEAYVLHLYFNRRCTNYTVSR